MRHHDTLPDGGEAVIAYEPDWSKLPPRNRACDNVRPTQAQADEARANAMTSLPTAANHP
jgi:hypothetical protein